MKRKLTELEIKDILDFDPDISSSVPSETTNSMIFTIKDKLRKQLEKVDIINDVRAVQLLKKEILRHYYTSKIQPGTPVGMLAASSASEPTMQMTLNTFHHSGIGSARGATMGLKRIHELLSITKNPESPNMIINFLPNIPIETIYVFSNSLEYLILKDIIKTTDISRDRILTDKENKCYRFYRKLYCDDAFDEQKELKYRWSIRLTFNQEKRYKYRIQLISIVKKLEEIFGDIYAIPLTEEMNTIDVYIDTANLQLFINEIIKDEEVKLQLDNKDWINKQFTIVEQPEKTTEEIEEEKQKIITIKEKIFLTSICKKALENVPIQGVEGIQKAYVVKGTRNSQQKNLYYVYTQGSNLKGIINLMREDILDIKNIYSNHFWDIYSIYGIEVGRQFLINEFIKVYSEGGSNIDNRHIQILVDMMTYSGFPISASRHGTKGQFGPLSRSSFEIPLVHFCDAAANSELDDLKGISASIMVGKVGSKIGTGAFDLIYDLDKHNKYKKSDVPAFDDNYDLSYMISTAESETLIPKFNYSVSNHSKI